MTSTTLDFEQQINKQILEGKLKPLDFADPPFISIWQRAHKLSVPIGGCMEYLEGADYGIHFVVTTAKWPGAEIERRVFELAKFVVSGVHIILWRRIE